MKFVFVFLGRTTEKYIAEGISDYAARLGRMAQVEQVVLRDKTPRSLPDEQYRREEGRILLDHCPAGSFVVALDAGGRTLDSESFARLLADREERGVHTVHFLIGGHLGLHADVLARADYVLSLSAMTFTHEMTRLILLEQVYRACMIKAGRKYHN